MSGDAIIVRPATADGKAFSMDLLTALECDRKALGLSQEQMAWILGMTQAWYSKVVNRKRRMSQRFANFVELAYRRDTSKYPFLETFFLAQNERSGESPNAEANDEQNDGVLRHDAGAGPAGDVGSDGAGPEAARGMVR